jgi:transcriptional regulator with XRE-family HTH domain
VSGYDRDRQPDARSRAFSPSDRSHRNLFPAAGKKPRQGREGGVPGPGEQRLLASSLGVALQDLRGQVGMSQRLLAARSGVHRTTVERVELGVRRPSGALLRALSVGLTRTIPSGDLEADWFLERLAAAAGGSLVVDTEGGVRRRRRRLAEAGKRWRWELRQWDAARRARFRAGERAYVEAMKLLTPSNFDNGAVLAEVDRLLAVARADWIGADRDLPLGATAEFRDMADEFLSGRLV